jgi:RNA recognition motif-containing protein
MKIFVGRLSKAISEADLQNLFIKYGHITSVYIRKDSKNGNNLYYGLVEMPVKKQALAAIEGVNGIKINGVELHVHPARIGEKNRRHSGRAGGRREYDPSEES